MTFLRVMEQAIRLVALAFLDLKRGGVCLLLTLFFALEVLVLWICANPTYDLWASGMVPIIRHLFGDYYLHYPQSFIGLPNTGAAGIVFLELLAGSFVAAWCTWAVLRLADSHSAIPEKLGVASLHAYPRVFLLALLELVVWVLLYALPQLLLLPHLGADYRLHALFSLGESLLPIVVLAPLFYALLLLVREERSFGKAISSSIALFRRDPWLPLLISILPWVMGIPFTYVLQRSASLSISLRPEIVLVVMAIGSAVSLVMAFVVIDSSVRLFLRYAGGHR